MTFDDLSSTIGPRDDLYRHVNGTWLDAAVIAPDKPVAGSFVDLRDASELAVREIIDDLASGSHPDGSDEAKIAAVYGAFMDEETIERLGADPLRPHLDRIEAIESITDLAYYTGWCLRHGVGTWLAMLGYIDAGQPDRYTTYIWQDGLGLPDEEYYRLEEHAPTLAAYRDHVSRSLALAGFEDADAQAEAVVDLEKAIAACHWDKVRMRDAVLTYNPTTWDDLLGEQTGVPWREIMAGAEVPEGHLVEFNDECPSFFTDITALLTEDRLPAWRSWARWHLIASLSRYLSAQFVDEQFDFYDKTLRGVPEQQPRWKRGVAIAEAALGEAIGRHYVERHFQPTAKARMDQLVEHLIEAYRRSISSLTWMGEQTRAEALDKLAKFTPKIGYPVRWRDYSALHLDADLIGDVLAVREFDYDFWLNRMNGPVDKDEWHMFPQTVNAYYNRVGNEIVFPAAILQPPFFDADADDAVNYGGIGSVIGHEIGHGFDDQGSQSDGDGRLRNWWTDDDREAFQQRTASLVAQYDALVPRQFADDPEAPHVNGSFTLGENIGDLGGLGIALTAWRLTTGDRPVEPIDGHSGEQRLFLSWARVWRTKIRDEAAKLRLATDPHSPAEFRCNQIARNVDAFHDAFGVQEGDPMWLDPRDRVTIW